MKRLLVLAMLAMTALLYQNCAQNDMSFDYADHSSALGIKLFITPDANNINEAQQPQKYMVEVKLPDQGEVSRENITVDGKRVDYVKNALGNYEFAFVPGSPKEYEIMAEVWSPNGTRFEAKEVLAIVDEHPPIVTITPDPKNSYADMPGLTQRFAITAVDEGGGHVVLTKCHINTSETPCELQSDGTAVAQTSVRGGLHNLYVDAVDNFGNMTRAVHVFSIGADLVAPLVSITPLASNTSYSIDSQIFAVSATDSQTGLQSVQCSLNGRAVSPCPSLAGGSVNITATVGRLLEGTNTLRVIAADSAVKDNMASPNTTTREHSFQILVDRDAPIVKLTANPANTKLVNQIQKVAFEVKDIGSGLKMGTLACKVDGVTVNCQANSSGIGEIAFTPSEPKSFKVEVSINDRYDNQGLAAVNVDVARDSNVPVITLAQDSANPAILLEGVTAKYNFTIRKDGTLSTVSSVRCFTAGVATACTTASDLKSGSFTSRFATAGTHTVRVEATDSTGNVGVTSLDVVVRRLEASTTSLAVNDNRMVDVLLVVDDSGSMKEEHTNMANRIGSFTSKLSALDWRAAVITTDVVNAKTSGRLQPIIGLTNRYWVTKDTANVQKLIGDTVQGVGLAGNGAEQGIKAASMLISAKDNAPNTGFFRANAALAVLFISDENESANTPLNSPANLVSQVQNLWPGKAFRAHSIVKISAACAGHTLGTRYLEISALTSGGTGCVGDADYSATLTAMGQSSADSVNAATLTCAPYNNQVVINRNGVRQNIAYTISGTNLTFGSSLPVGQYSLVYSCVR